MKEIQNTEEFQTLLTEEGVKVVDFWASWCGPCKMMVPVLEEVAEQVGPKAEIVKVNIEDVPALSAEYRIRAIPTLMFFKDGELVETKAGVMTATDLRNKIEEIA